jgi:hypothetical protein
MSAYFHRTNEKAEIVWIDHTGKLEDLELNFFAYDIDFCSSLYKNRIGIPYKNLTKEELAVFQDAAVTVVDMLSKSGAITERDQERFIKARAVVQDGQRVAETEDAGGAL